MFKPRNKSDRLNYGEMLCPPFGYTLENALATSYTLDLNTLTASAFSLCMNGETDTDQLNLTAMCYRATKELASKAVIFCEAGKIKRPTKSNPIYTLLSPALCTINLQTATSYPSFHPKIWLAQYKNAEDDRRYRLLVLSRNLTFDRSYDSCIMLEGKESAFPQTQTQPLTEFLQYLKGFTKTQSQQIILDSLIQRLPMVEFSAGKYNFAFFPLGIKEKYNRQLYSQLCNRANTVMSPFLTQGVVEDFGIQNLFTRRSQLSVLANVAQRNPSIKECNVYALKEQIIDGERFLVDDEPLDAELHQEPCLQDIHAKIYATKDALYLGSANASHSAFNRNVEFVVGLYLQKQTRGVKRQYKMLLTDLIGDLYSDDAKKRATVPFEQIDWEDIMHYCAVNQEQESAKQRLNLAIKQLCNMPITARVTHTNPTTPSPINSTSNSSPIYNIEVNIEGDLTIFNSVSLSLCPLGESPLPLASTMHFANVQLQHLSQLYSVTATTSYMQDEEEQSVTTQCVLKIATDNIPQFEVETCIVNLAISSALELEQYLESLLSWDVMQGYFSAKSSGLGGTGGSGISAGLYERLLFACQHMPERVKEITEINQRLEQSKVSQQLKSVIELFMQAVQSQSDKWE